MTATFTELKTTFEPNASGAVQKPAAFADMVSRMIQDRFGMPAYTMASERKPKADKGV